MHINHTHDPSARSWADSAGQGGDFPIQNLPYGVFRRAGTEERWRAGVAIGDAVLDLAGLARTRLLEAGQGDAARLAQRAAEAAATSELNGFMAMGPAAWRTLRHALFALLREGVAGEVREAVQACLVPQHAVEHRMPVRAGDYTDFYTSLHHARNCGKAIGNPDMVSPNFLWMPIAYHGRASTLGVDQQFHRPLGQCLAPGAQAPVVRRCERLDYELELAVYIGQPNVQGQPVPLGQAEEHVFGLGLLNDWSARDVQFWEMAPLGPFLAKNFATTVSPWIVTMEALAPFRSPFEREAHFPAPLPYLDGAELRQRGVLDIELSVTLQTAQMRERGSAGALLSRSNFRHQHWTVSQMLAHHTMGGCSLQPGDILGTGTISGPEPSEAGALLELAQAGKQPFRLPDGEERSFLHDGDAVILRGWCERAGAARIGFGACRGQVLPAIA